MTKCDHTEYKHSSDQVSGTDKVIGTTQSSVSKEKMSQILTKVNREAAARLADYELRQEAALFRRTLESLAEGDEVKTRDVDKHFLKGFLSYASRLYTTGEISEESYVSLVTQAAESYAKRLVESKIAKYLEKYEVYLGKASIR